MKRILFAHRVATFAGALLAASLTAACTPTTQAPAADPSAVPSFGANDMPPGTKVLVARQGQWLPATIIQPLAEGRFFIHYDALGNEMNEVVGPDRLKPFAAPGPARDYKPGEKVLISFKDRTMLGDVVLQAGPDTWRVHYDGFGPEAAETVGPDRLRRPFAGASAHAVGEALQVDVNGQPLGAKVIAIAAADKWLVRFDSYGPQYDQEIGADRIKTAAPPPPPPAPPPVVSPAPPPVSEPAPPPKPEKPEKPAKPEKAAPAPKPAAAPTNDAPAVPAGPPAAGEAVMVSIRGIWFPATISAPGAGGAFKIKVGAAPEEEVAADRIVRIATGKGRYQTNQAVLVHFKGIWVGAKILKQTAGTEYKVRFDGTGPEEDEVVQSKRLRPR